MEGHIGRAVMARRVRLPRGRRTKACGEASHAEAGNRSEAEIDCPEGSPARGERSESNPVFDPAAVATGSVARIPREHGADARTQEVGPIHSTEEVGEQSGCEETCGGVDGGKGEGQGESF